MEGINSFLSWVGHTLSGAAIIGTLLGYFPAVAAAVAMLWYVVQLYESRTVQRWLQSRRLRKIAKLKIEMARLEALELVQYPNNPAGLAHAKDEAEKLIDKARDAAKVVLDADRG